VKTTGRVMVPTAAAAGPPVSESKATTMSAHPSGRTRWLRGEWCSPGVSVRDQKHSTYDASEAGGACSSYAPTGLVAPDGTARAFGIVAYASSQFVVSGPLNWIVAPQKLPLTLELFSV
jgi:hypothetical protein